MEPINLSDKTKGDEPLNVLLYGLAGCGKTHLAGTFPDPIAVIDIDNKHEPMMGKDVDIYPFYMTKNEDAKLMIPGIWKLWQELKKADKYRTIILDSVTALDRMLERYTVIMCGKGKASGERATLQEYGDMKRWYRTFFPSLASCPDKNIVVIAHEQTKEDDKNRPISIRPLITGKTGDEISSMFKHTFHMERIKSGATMRWELRYDKQGLYVASSSVFSGGTGVITIQPGENGYEVLMRELAKAK